MNKIIEKLGRIGLTLLTMFIAFSCSKDDVPSVVPEPEYIPSVYTVGETDTPSGFVKAAIWKDGTQIFLESLNNGSSLASGVFVKDNDVYASGEINNTKQQAVYWKNGNRVVLDNASSISSQASTIFVDGSNVYVGGEERMSLSGTYEPVYWVNGVKTILPVASGKGGRVTSIVFKNGNIYACGYESLSGRDYVAKLWVNGVATDLAADCTAYDIFVDGTNVYVCGKTVGNPVETGKVWRNGVVTNYTAPDSVALYSIEVKDGNVYLAGAERNSTTGDYNARYWVNSTKNTLPSSNNYSEAIGIALYGNSIYLGGSVEHNTTFEYNAKYWINNIMYDLKNNDINNYTYVYGFAIK